MMESMGRHPLRQPGCCCCPLDCLLERLLVHGMTPDDAGARIGRFVIGRKCPKPFPLRPDLRVFSLERIGQHPFRPPRRAICAVASLGIVDLFASRRGQRNRQHGHPVLASISLPDKDFPTAELHILDPQGHARHQAHAGALHQARQQRMHPLHFVEDGGHFPGRQYGRQPRRRVGTVDVVHPWKVGLQHLLV